MSSAVHYKLKAGPGISAAASSTWSSIHFDGVHMSLLDLKRRIIYKEQWWRSEADAQFDLLLSNSNSGEEYRDDDYNLHRNVSVMVKRVPATSIAHARRLFIAPGSLGPDWNKSTADANATPLGQRPGGAGGAGAGGVEDSDIAALINQRGNIAGAHLRPTGPFQQTFTARTLTRDSKPPPGYRCHRCKKEGHYIQFCPTNSDPAYDQHNRAATTRAEREAERQLEKSRITNSRSYGERDYSRGYGAGGGGGGLGEEAPSEAKSSQWLKPVEDPKAIEGGGERPLENLAADVPKQRMFSSAFFAGNAATLPHSLVPLAPPPNPHSVAAAAAASASAAASAAASLPPPLRADLTCQICKDYFVDAHVLGCCYTSFCRECIEDKFKETGCCPACNSSDVVVPDDLSPNHNLQKAVEQFLAENPAIERGAIKKHIAQAAEKAHTASMEAAAAADAAAAAPAAAPAIAPAAPAAAAAYSNGAAQYGGSVSVPSASSSYGARPAGGARPARGCFTCGSLGHAAKYCPTIGGPGGPGDPDWIGHAHNRQQRPQQQSHYGGQGYGGQSYGAPSQGAYGQFGGQNMYPQMQMPLMGGMQQGGGGLLQPPMGGMPMMGGMQQQLYMPQQMMQQQQGGYMPGNGALLPHPAPAAGGSGQPLLPDSHKRHADDLDEEQQYKRRRD